MGFWGRFIAAAAVVILVSGLLHRFTPASVTKQLSLAKHTVTVLSAVVFAAIAWMYFTQNHEVTTGVEVSAYWFNWMMVCVSFFFLQGFAAIFGRVDDVVAAVTDIVISFIALAVVVYILVDYSRLWSATQWDVYMILLAFPIYDCIVNVVNLIRLRGRLSGFAAAA